jgi:hypothetical protein
MSVEVQVEDRHTAAKAISAMRRGMDARRETTGMVKYVERGFN